MAKALKVMRDRSPQTIYKDGVRVVVKPLSEPEKDRLYREAHVEAEGGKGQIYNGRQYVVNLVLEGIMEIDVEDALTGEKLEWNAETVGNMDEDDRQEFVTLVTNPAKNLAPKVAEAKKLSPSG